MCGNKEQVYIVTPKRTQGLSRDGSCWDGVLFLRFAHWLPFLNHGIARPFALSHFTSDIRTKKLPNIKILRLGSLFRFLQ